MEKALSYITVLPSTGAQQDLFARQVIESVNNGEINPLFLDVQLSSIEKTIEMIRRAPSVKEAVVKEMMKYEGEGKTIDIHGAKVTISNRKSYEFNDSKLEAMEKELNQLKARIKAREMLLQTQDCDPDTGELFEKPIVKNKAVISIKF